jgi:hypothetical protein
MEELEAETDFLEEISYGKCAIDCGYYPRQ